MKGKNPGHQRPLHHRLRNALADGEDYELLFAISPRAAKRLESAWKKKFPKLPLTRIGELFSNRQSEIDNLKFDGFDHYA